MQFPNSLLHVALGFNAQLRRLLRFGSQVVFYMPNEEVMTKGDLSRELCFVLHGACHIMQEDRVQRVVRDDVSLPSH
jgi:hypothetical protein